MDEASLTRWADLLTGYCLRVAKGEAVGIYSEIEARPLVEACYRSVVARGGIPLLRLSLPGLEEHFLRHSTDEQLATIPGLSYYEADSLPCRIRISAETDTRSMAQVDPRRQAIRDRAYGPVRKLMGRNRWVITQYPTASYAADARMPLGAYSKYVASAMFLDHSSPENAWIELGRRQAAYADFFKTVRQVHIEAPGTDLTLDVSGRTWINSDGRRNMPSGEIFTGPVEDSAHGTLACSFPVCRGGREVGGIALQFRNGEVVSAQSSSSQDYLLEMLDLDPGARRVGELGIGLNPGIDRFTGSILYDEKIAGTIHVALGQSYPETGGTNTSALHWDLIVDLRQDGRIRADGRVVMENGNWLIG